MKNMVVLKNLPSNIIEEAFVVLKPNKRVKIVEHTENQAMVEQQEDYIVKEAEMVVSSYISAVDEEPRKRKSEIRQIENKYKKLKKVNTILSILLVINVIIGLIAK